MKSLIVSKHNEYLNARSDNSTLRAWLRDSDLWYWLYGLMRITGTPMSKETIMTVLDGRIDEKLSIETYNTIQAYAALFRDMQSCKDMQISPDLKTVNRWYSILFGPEDGYRKTTHVVYQLGFVPMHFGDMESSLAALFRKYSRSSDYPVASAAMLSLEFLKIYPYAEQSTAMSNVLLMYCLLCADYPLPTLSCSETEFNDLVTLYVRDDDPSAYVSMIERNVLNRLEAALAVCLQARDANEKDI